MKNRIPIDIEHVCKSCHWWISDKCINHSELDGTFNNTDESVTLHCYYSEEEHQREDNP
jgi:aspartate carbamoyltransferase regulatory subunit